MIRSIRFVVVATLAAAACGGEKAQSADSTPKSEPKLQASPNPTDTLKPATSAADPSKPKADSTGAKKAAGPLRDSAFGPKFTVDSAGKVKAIKKP
jgi:hypothetical protein